MFTLATRLDGTLREYHARFPTVDASDARLETSNRSEIW